MITGDNALTGSNISFKCEIADIKKKMIICDYRNDKFVTEDFIFT
jgi:magnesium-transporting ATPase (P-type)